MNWKLLVGAAIGTAAWAGEAEAGTYYCNGRPTTERTCPDGSLAIYRSEPISAVPPSPPPPSPRPRPPRRPDRVSNGGGTGSGDLGLGPGTFCGAVRTTERTCPDGSLPWYRSTPARLLTREEMAAMNEATRREAARIARIWSGDGRLNAAQIDAINRGTCILMPAYNPELRCVGAY